MGPGLKGLEIGVWYGQNMGHLLDNCPNIEFLCGVDPYEPYQDWNRYIDEEMMDSAKKAAVEVLLNFPVERCTLIQGTSENFHTSFNSVPGNKLDFIFIDGDHSYESCYKDLNLWYDSVRSGGLFSGHDFSLPGVNKALAQFRKERNIKGFFKVIPNDVWYWIKD